jgi:FkbM family methyltransferase
MKIYWSIKKRLHRLLRPRYQLVSRQGMRLLLDNRNWIDTRLLIGQPYEEEQIASCARLIRNNDIEIFLDVGANIGLYSVMINHLASPSETHAFEPVRRNFHQLCGNLFVNELSYRVTPHCLALSDEKGEATIHVDPTSTGVSRLSLEDGGRASEVFTEQETIELARLDDLFHWQGRRLFIKIDVEGHELPALRGMQRILRDNLVILQVEAFAGEPTEALAALMREFDYEALPNPGGDYRFSNFQPENTSTTTP